MPNSNPQIMMNDKRSLEFDLYLDESGRFLETSNVPGEREAQDFPSQFAGFLVPRGDIKSEAGKIFQACAEAAYGPTKLLRTGNKTVRISAQPANLKGSDLKGPKLVRFVRQIVKEFAKRPTWEPVRIANQEAVSYGDEIAAYTNIFADLILRILEQKSLSEPDANISIQVFCTTQMRDGVHDLHRSEYTSRLNEYLNFLAVRRGLAAESSKWTLYKFVPNLGRDHPALRIADALSNHSLGDFRKIDYKSKARRSDEAKSFIAIFGERNWTMTVRELFERVSVLIEEYSFGMALIAIAEALGSEASLEGYDPAYIEKAQEHISNINRLLVRMGGRGRDPQLATVLNWLDQIVGHQRLTERGYRLARWLLTNVVEALRLELKDKEGQTIDWFEYGVRRWALTAANHEGKLFDADVEAVAMRTLARSLARQWERAPILFDGLISQAVHLTDAFEFDRVSHDMHLVVNSLETQSDLFSNYHDAEFPDPIKFDLRAKAMGTLVQNEMLKGFADSDQLQQVRELSNAAIEEFTDPKDKARQYQYRCHLETIAGAYGEARKSLIWSIRKAQTNESDYSHAAIGRLLAGATDDPQWMRVFTASHWLRLGATVCLDGAIEREKFLTAYDNSNMFKTYVESDSLSDFPIHNILRFLAVIEASRRKFGKALKALERFHSLDPIGKSEFTMALILCACQAEVAGLYWTTDATKARQLLDGSGQGSIGLTKLFSKIRAARVEAFPSIAALIESWETKIDSLITADTQPGQALSMLREIGSDVRH